MFDAKTFWAGFVLGMVILGLAIVLADPPNSKPKEISYTQLEKDIDRAQCQADIYRAVLSERIRLTGQPNPEPKGTN